MLGVQKAQPFSAGGKSNFPAVDVQVLSRVNSTLVVNCKVRLYPYNIDLIIKVYNQYCLIQLLISVWAASRSFFMIFSWIFTGPSLCVLNTLKYVA